MLYKTCQLLWTVVRLKSNPDTVLQKEYLEIYHRCYEKLFLFRIFNRAIIHQWEDNQSATNPRYIFDDCFEIF